MVHDLSRRPRLIHVADLGSSIHLPTVLGTIRRHPNARLYDPMTPPASADICHRNPQYPWPAAANTL